MEKSTVAWPDWRLDVLAALERLATIDHENIAEWPDLSNAVHWLVDDTWWDMRPPEDSIGEILLNQAEANAVGRVVAAVLCVLADVGPTSSDAACLDHPQWRDVTLFAQAAFDLMSSPE